jgi:hypothetical protein
MKKVIVVIGLAMATLFLSDCYSFAGGECGMFQMPVQISPGVFFVSDDTICAMDGDPTQPITWAGDQEYWAEMPTENYVYNNTPGILVSGTGHDFKRWNLRQKGHPNNGWLPIENAFPIYGCPNIYSRGKETPSGHDWKGKGPAFWYVQPEVTINIPTD